LYQFAFAVMAEAVAYLAILY